MMRKIGIVLCVMGLILCTGCAKGKAQEKIDASAVSAQMTQRLAFSDSLTLLETERVSEFYEIDPKNLSFSIVYLGTGATCEEIAVFEVKKEEHLEEVQKAVQKRIETQKEAYADYLPEQAAKLEDAVVITKGNAVFFVVSDDNAGAEKILNSAFSEKK